MLVQVVGCSHHGTSIAIRERLAFRPSRPREALDHWRRVFPGVEAVLLSTCNRVEIYAATRARAGARASSRSAGFLARFHGLDPAEVAPHLYQYSDDAAVRHLFTVAASLDSMVLGEPQILAQVKQAYQAATEQRQHRPAAARGLSGGHARRPPRGHRNGHPPAAREHSQRGRGRLRPADLRALRRQADAGHRRRRNGRRDPALSARRRGPADHGRQPALRAGRASWPARWQRPRAAVGGAARRRWPPPTWSSAPRARRSRSSRWRRSRGSRRAVRSGRC